jgi:hypothetical protein
VHPELTDEQRARIRAEARAVRDRVMGAAPARVPRAPAVRRAGPSRRGENLKSRPPKYDRTEAKRLYDEGLTTSQIAERMGAHRATVAVMLDELGVDPAERKGGPSRKQMCGKGLHDMSVHGAEVKGGGRYCKACKSERGKKAWRSR